jgi:hypothetical protein
MAQRSKFLPILKPQSFKPQCQTWEQLRPVDLLSKLQVSIIAEGRVTMKALGVVVRVFVRQQF